MIKKDPGIRCQAALDEIEYLLDIHKTTSYDDFVQSSDKVRGVSYSILVISEATHHLPEEWKQKYPQIPQREIKDMGNMLRHEYHKVEDQILWSVIDGHIQPLKIVLLDMMEKNQ